MTSARTLIVDPEASGYYHCVSRCVRRAFLCGYDPVFERDCSHRKQWIEDRLVELAQLFALNVYAYAVMSNHLHVVVQLEPAIVRTWSAEEIAERWARLFPVTVNGKPDAEANAQRRATSLGQPQRLAVCRRSPHRLIPARAGELPAAHRGHPRRGFCGTIRVRHFG